MFVAFNADGDLLEIGVEYFDDENREHVFYGDAATKPYRLWFERQRQEKKSCPEPLQENPPLLTEQLRALLPQGSESSNGALSSSAPTLI